MAMGVNRKTVVPTDPQKDSWEKDFIIVFIF